jgi:bifunctional DNase/RNase
LDAEVERVAITDLRNDTFYAQITLRVNGRRLEVDSRPSDAIALAVRTHVSVFVDEAVMDQAAITPEQDLETGETAQPRREAPETPDAFKEFLEGLDLGGLD